MENIQWTVSPPQAGKDRIEYVPVTKSGANSSDAEKESVRVWNLMVKTLRDNGLMKDKGEK